MKFAPEKKKIMGIRTRISDNYWKLRKTKSLWIPPWQDERIPCTYMSEYTIFMIFRYIAGAVFLFLPNSKSIRFLRILIWRIRDFWKLCRSKFIFFALFERPWGVLCANVMPIHYSSSTRTPRNKNRINYVTEMQSGDDEICTHNALCQNDRAECVESVAGRAPWSAQALY